MEHILKYFPNLSDKQKEQFAALYDLYIDWNSKINVISRKDIENLYLHHVLHSLGIAKMINFRNGTTVMDFGCGGGFPSLVIAILRGDVSVFAVDSVSKKVRYVSETSSLLGLDNVTVSSERAEVIGQGEKREKFDIVTARAVARLNILCELCIPLLKVGGTFISMKSQTTDEEIDEARGAIELLGGKIKDVKFYTLTDGRETVERTLILIEKVKQTPKIYPRNNSQIAKKPL